jgi:hypothetical protein
MARLALYVIVITIFLSILGVTAILLGRLEIPQDQLGNLGISRCASRLCVLDIQAGITSWEETKAKFINRGGSIETDGDSITVKYETFEVNYWPNFESKSNVEIRSTTDIPLLTLGDLIINFDLPCYATITEDTVFLEHAEFLASVPIENNKNPFYAFLTPLSPITRLSFANLPCNEPLTFPTSKNILLYWCGFRSLGQLKHCEWPFR